MGENLCLLQKEFESLRAIMKLNDKGYGLSLMLKHIKAQPSIVKILNINYTTKYNG